MPNQKNQALQRLFLGENQIGDAGATTLAEGIAVSPFCSFFLRVGCWLALPSSVTHVISVILVLQKNTALNELLLGGNKIGDEGGKAIGKALEVSPAFVSSFSFPCAVTSSR